MPVKRSLKLDGTLEENSLGPAKNTRKKNIAAYSPTTGTRQMSPFCSPINSKGQDHPNEPSNDFDRKSFAFAKNTRKKNIAAYSPTTGTRQMSPFRSPINSKGQDHPNEPSNEKCGKLNNLNLPESKKSTTDADAEFMRLLSTVKKSSEEILDIMNGLSSIQALEGSRELENLIGFTHTPGLLQEELKKTEELSKTYFDKNNETKTV